eukprot:100344-Chlamydomonas_euryale.AAC.2
MVQSYGSGPAGLATLSNPPTRGANISGGGGATAMLPPWEIPLAATKRREAAPMGGFPKRTCIGQVRARDLTSRHLAMHGGYTPDHAWALLNVLSVLGSMNTMRGNDGGGSMVLFIHWERKGMGKEQGLMLAMGAQWCCSSIGCIRRRNGEGAHVGDGGGVQAWDSRARWDSCVCAWPAHEQAEVS